MLALFPNINLDSISTLGENPLLVTDEASPEDQNVFTEELNKLNNENFLDSEKKVFKPENGNYLADEWNDEDYSKTFEKKKMLPDDNYIFNFLFQTTQQNCIENTPNINNCFVEDDVKKINENNFNENNYIYDGNEKELKIKNDSSHSINDLEKRDNAQNYHTLRNNKNLILNNKLTNNDESIIKQLDIKSLLYLRENENVEPDLIDKFNIDFSTDDNSVDSIITKGKGLNVNKIENNSIQNKIKSIHEESLLQIINRFEADTNKSESQIKTPQNLNVNFEGELEKNASDDELKLIKDTNKNINNQLSVELKVNEKISNPKNFDDFAEDKNDNDKYDTEESIDINKIFENNNFEKITNNINNDNKILNGKIDNNNLNGIVLDKVLNTIESIQHAGKAKLNIKTNSGEDLRIEIKIDINKNVSLNFHSNDREFIEKIDSSKDEIKKILNKKNINLKEIILTENNFENNANKIKIDDLNLSFYNDTSNNKGSSDEGFQFTGQNHNQSQKKDEYNHEFQNISKAKITKKPNFSYGVKRIGSSINLKV